MRPNREEAPNIENYVERLESYIDELEGVVARMESDIGNLAKDLTRVKESIGMVLYRHRWATEMGDRGTCDCDTCRYLTGNPFEDMICSRDREMTPEGWQAMERGACPLWSRKAER